MPNWVKKGYVTRVKDIKSHKLLPGVVNEVVNIIRALDKMFPAEGPITYGNKTAVETAFIIHRVYGDKIKAYMKRKIFYKTENFLVKYGEEEALKEQLARGYVHKDKIKLDHSLPYIKSNVDKNIVWPKQYTMNDIYIAFEDIGVAGFTGIVVPRKFR
jgi:hypothetical protein